MHMHGSFSLFFLFVFCFVFLTLHFSFVLLMYYLLHILLMSLTFFVLIEGGDLFKFGHLIKDGELQIKTSDQPPKKR